MLFKEHTIHSTLISHAENYPHGTVVPYHSHNCAQLLHTLSGVIRVETNKGIWVMPPNRGVWIPSGIQHSLKIIGAVQVRTLFVDPLARADLPHTCAVVGISDLLKALIVEAVSIPENRPTGSREERIIELILDELRRLKNIAFHVPMPHSEILVRLCQQINLRISHPWTTADAAALLNTSERTVARQFQQELALTFGEWLRRSRLLRAFEHLASGDSILETALAIGYDSPSAFSAMFKSRVGISPRDYLQQAREAESCAV